MPPEMQKKCHPRYNIRKHAVQNPKRTEDNSLLTMDHLYL
jgi:hypothetical protein